jgi:predicted O-methyltransferase YrrM
VLKPDAQLTWSESAMTPAGLAAVRAKVTGRHRRRIVECGSRFSTLVLARLLHTREGRLVSLEHDQTWATRVQSNLAAAGLAEIAQVALAPLEPHPLARDGLQWYAHRALRSLPRRIDLLLVDGHRRSSPSSSSAAIRRYPRSPSASPPTPPWCSMTSTAAASC